MDRPQYTAAGHKELHERIDHELTNHPPKSAVIGQRMDDISAVLREAGHLIVGICPQGRELSLALTHLQQTRMYAIAALALNQEEIDG